MISTLLVPNLPVDYRTESLLTLVTGHCDGSVCFWELNYDYEYIESEERDYIRVLDASKLCIPNSGEIENSTSPMQCHLDNDNYLQKESYILTSNPTTPCHYDSRSSKNSKYSDCYSWQLKSTATLPNNNFSSIN